MLARLLLLFWLGEMIEHAECGLQTNDLPLRSAQSGAEPNATTGDAHTIAMPMRYL
jgi:hypothetical protein